MKLIVNHSLCLVYCKNKKLGETFWDELRKFSISEILQIISVHILGPS